MCCAVRDVLYSATHNCSAAQAQCSVAQTQCAAAVRLLCTFDMCVRAVLCNAWVNATTQRDVIRLSLNAFHGMLDLRSSWVGLNASFHFLFFYFFFKRILSFAKNSFFFSLVLSLIV